MKSLWNAIRTIMAAIGIILVFGGIGASDYYVMELEQTEPSCVWKMIVAGLILLLPSVVHALRNNHNDNGGVRK